MIKTAVILSVMCLSLSACNGNSGEALSMGGFSGSTQGANAPYSGARDARTSMAGSEGGLYGYPRTVSDTQLDRRGL